MICSSAMHAAIRRRATDALACACSCCGACTEECDYIIAKAKPRLSRSQVVSSDKSDSSNRTVEELSDIRTSQGMFFERGEDEMIKCKQLQAQQSRQAGRQAVEAGGRFPGLTELLLLF